MAREEAGGVLGVIMQSILRQDERIRVARDDNVERLSKVFGSELTQSLLLRPALCSSARKEARTSSS